MTPESIKALAEKEYPGEKAVEFLQRTAFIKGAMLVVEENKLVQALKDIIKDEPIGGHNNGYHKLKNIARDAISSLELKPPANEPDDDGIGNAIAALVYYSQIHTVKSVQPVEFPTHDEAWRMVQKWLWTKCKRVVNNYVLPIPAPASESREAQPAKPDEGSGLVWVKASERLPNKEYSFGENEFGCFPIRWDFEYRTVLGIGYLNTDIPIPAIYNSMNCEPFPDVKIEWLDETGSAPIDNGKEAKGPVVVLNRSQVEEIWNKCESLKGWIIDSELEVEKKTLIDNLFNQK